MLYEHCPSLCARDKVMITQGLQKVRYFWISRLYLVVFPLSRTKIGIADILFVVLLKSRYFNQTIFDIIWMPSLPIIILA